MKPIAVVALAVALLIGSATTALASSRTTDEAVALPAHGSVWSGNGLASYGVEISPVNSFDAAMIARGAAHDQVSVQSAVLAQTPANSFDAAMIARGPVRGWMAQRGLVQVTH